MAAEDIERFATVHIEQPVGERRGLAGEPASADDGVPLDRAQTEEDDSLWNEAINRQVTGTGTTRATSTISATGTGTTGMTAVTVTGTTGATAGIGTTGMVVPEVLAMGEEERMKAVDATALMHALGVWRQGYRGRGEGDGRLDPYTLLTAGARLETMGLCMMPDGRCPFRVKDNDKIVVYPRPVETSYPVTYRSVTLTVVYMAAWFVQHDYNDADLAAIDAYITKATTKGRSSLPAQALLRWLLSRKRIMSKRVKVRAQRQMSRFVHKRSEALDLLLSLATNGASPSPRRLKNLETLLPLFGIAAAETHTLLHRHATGHSLVPKKAVAETLAAPVLDMRRLAQMEADTRNAQAMLQEVFDNEAVADIVPNPATLPTEPSIGAAAQGKNDRYTRLLRQLATQETWPIAAYRALCEQYQLLPSAALEAINDLSYELTDSAVAEEADDDTIAIDTDIASRLIEQLTG